MKMIKLITVTMAATLLAGCNGCNNNENREKPDVSKLDIQVHIQRFDHDFMAVANTDYATWNKNMDNKYGGFYQLYLSPRITGIQPGTAATDSNERFTRLFIADHTVNTIQDSIDARYKEADIKKLEEELAQSFKYFKYYYPAFRAPQVFAFNSLFQFNVATFGPDTLLLGLDMFLEPNKDYDSAGVFSYVRHKMTRQNIVRYSDEVLYNDYFAESMARSQNLAEAIIESGKKLYFLSYILPDAPDSLILGYTQAQTDWCKQSEYSIWAFFNDKDLLYKSNSMDYTRYLGDGPTTAGMPLESPGAIGNFVGLQIVRKYMKEASPKVSLFDLITKTTAKDIMEKAKYHPQKQGK